MRYIAINDGVDSAKGDNDFTPFRNLFNDFMFAIQARNSCGQESQRTGRGACYIKNPNDKKKWIVEEEAAEVVKRIFALCIAGKGPMQVTKALKADKVLTPKAYSAKCRSKQLPANLYHWEDSSIVRILGQMDYCGHTVAIKKQRREVEQAKKRIAELDRIFKPIYEDDISGAISHERFLKLSAEYETEQRELTNKAAEIQREADTYEQDKADFNSYSAVVRKYVGIKELTPTIVNEFINRIVVHAPNKSSGKRVQKVDIVWNFIGMVDFHNEPQTKTTTKEKTA